MSVCSGGGGSGSYRTLLTSEHGREKVPCKANRPHKESLCGAKSHTGVRDRRREGEREREKKKE